MPPVLLPQTNREGIGHGTRDANATNSVAGQRLCACVHRQLNQASNFTRTRLDDSIQLGCHTQSQLDDEWYCPATLGHLFHCSGLSLKVAASFKPAESRRRVLLYSLNDS